MHVETWSNIFKQQDDEGKLLPPEQLPLVRPFEGLLSLPQNILDRKPGKGKIEKSFSNSLIRIIDREQVNFFRERCYFMGSKRFMKFQ
jgi:hypothetical protein